MIALNPKEYYKRFNDHSDKKNIRNYINQHEVWILYEFMNLYSERLSDLNEFPRDYIKKPKKNLQKRLKVIHESMQMKSVSKVQFGQLNDK